MRIAKGMNRVYKDGKIYGYNVATGKLFDVATLEEVKDDGSGDSNKDNQEQQPSEQESVVSKAKAIRVK